MNPGVMENAQARSMPRGFLPGLRLVMGGMTMRALESALNTAHKQAGG